MRTKSTLLIATLVFATSMVGTAFAGKIIYVDADATGGNNGSSWADAYIYLQDALAASQATDQIRVAEGTYKPDQGVGITPGNRTATFQLKNGVIIKGGYAGFGEPDPNARNFEVYETILSGDLAGDDGPDFTNNAENSYHVVAGSGTDATAILDGFTITAGNADQDFPFPHRFGGGMWSYEGSPKLNNCTFTANSAFAGGGAMYNDHSSPTLTNCTFIANASSRGGGIHNENSSSPPLADCKFTGNSGRLYGGGMYNHKYSSPLLTDCIFEGNSSSTGAGMYNDGLMGSCWPVLANCVFSRNSASNSAGGMYNNWGSNSILINCAFTGNSAGYAGGGMWNYKSSPSLSNCLFVGNLAQFGGGMHNNFSSPVLTNCTFTRNAVRVGIPVSSDGGGISNANASNPVLVNCILWGDSPQEILGTATVTYSDVQGGWLGQGNIDTDPFFLEPGYWDADGVWTDGDYHLQPGSPCMDVGDNTALPPDILDLDGDGDIGEAIPFDIEGNPRVMNSIVDMGAFEGFVIYVTIDIKPGSYPNAINLGSHGLIPVAILSGDEFDATSVNPDSVELGGAGVEVRGKSNRFMAHEEDVDADGLVDLVVHVATENLDPGTFQDGYAILSGTTYDGVLIEGADEITIVPAKQ